MSYYIAPHSDNYMVNKLVAWRVVKRLKDFKAEDGKYYQVFRSKKEMRSSLFVPLYKGVNGRLKKQMSDFTIRF